MAPAPLLRLPLELLRNIFDHLDIQDRVRLAMTNRYLRSVIDAPTHTDFLDAERSEWAASKGLYTCKGCGKFRWLDQFANDMRKGPRARHGPEAQDRFCFRCGAEKGWYATGVEITVLGKRLVLGELRRKLTDRNGAKESCGTGTPVWRTLPQQGNRINECQDDWNYLAPAYAEGRHADDIYGLWPDV